MTVTRACALFLWLSTISQCRFRSANGLQIGRKRSLVGNFPEQLIDESGAQELSKYVNEKIKSISELTGIDFVPPESQTGALHLFLSPSPSAIMSSSVTPSVSTSTSPSSSSTASATPTSVNKSPEVSVTSASSSVATSSPSSTITPSNIASVTPSISEAISKSPSTTPSVTTSVSPAVSTTTTPTVEASISPTSSVAPSITTNFSPSVSTTITPTTEASIPPTASATTSVSPSATSSATASISPSTTSSVTPSITPTATPTSSPSISTSPSASPVPQDPNGINLIYASEDKLNPTSFQSNDWVSSWASYPQTVDLTSVYDVDPYDNRAVLRGNGDIQISNGLLYSINSPRLYIASGSGAGWENVEFTAYGYYSGDYTSTTSSRAGLTLVARSSHSLYAEAACQNALYAGKVCGPCKAAGYYTKIYRNPGTGKDEIMFQKEYYHDLDDNSSIYAATRRTSFFADGILPAETWIGMKFIVYSVPATSWVKLELYIDTTDGLNGGTWNLVHETLDFPMNWVAAGGADVPAECVNDTPNGSPVYGPRDDCFLRSDSSYVYWKNASIRRIDPGVKL